MEGTPAQPSWEGHFSKLTMWRFNLKMRLLVWSSSWGLTAHPHPGQAEIELAYVTCNTHIACHICFMYFSVDSSEKPKGFHNGYPYFTSAKLGCRSVLGKTREPQSFRRQQLKRTTRRPHTHLFGTGTNCMPHSLAIHMRVHTSQIGAIVCQLFLTTCGEGY